ncbi:MAG: hypothetical protein V2J25_11800 [Desulfatiglans sp.]|jgi:hypothetical protein|nr:hypothetical protein [Thermodesulfobacteriota bacterium]MEE4353542.1 hypothetical protein [Desulfatiglans sp.]
MIVDHPQSHFIFLYHPKVFSGEKYTVYEGKELTNGEMLEYWGKWIVLGKREWLDHVARELNPSVEEEKIPCIKYDRAPSVNLGVEECVMMVYCDKRERDDVWRILRQHEVMLKAWVSERETMEMWMPGGRLLERWIRSRNLDRAQADIAREDARSRLCYIFDHPDEVFVPWEQ